MTKKRGNGEGSIYQRKDDRWVGQVLIGHDAEGKPQRKTIYGKTRKDVAAQVTKTLSDVQNGTIIKANRVTVEQWLDRWINYYQERVSPNFIFRRKELIRLHINPALGKKYWSNFCRQILEYFIKIYPKQGVRMVKAV
jgi:integrase